MIEAAGWCASGKKERIAALDFRLIAPPFERLAPVGGRFATPASSGEAGAGYTGRVPCDT